MAEPLKDLYHEGFLREFGRELHSAYSEFALDQFVTDVMDASWEGLALKARMRHIVHQLGRHLPPRYEDALAVLLAVNDRCRGFEYLILPDFVEVFGQAEVDWGRSIEALERFTRHSSAEFAVRPFILRDPERMMEQMRRWALHPNEHVRRLSSEGCRPRLPWGQALKMFKQDPSPILPVLELLKADPSLYVRKSVANNLNDIAKDHPQQVLELAGRWRGTHSDTDWIVRHGCRTMIRQAIPEALELFGYADPSAGTIPLAAEAGLSAEPAELAIGESGELHYELLVREGEPVRVRIEYGIYFVKANGRTSRKLFLLSDKTVPGGSRLSGTRIHRWADLTTRRHYPGLHRVVLVLNGREVAATEIVVHDNSFG